MNVKDVLRRIRQTVISAISPENTEGILWIKYDKDRQYPYSFYVHDGIDWVPVAVTNNQNILTKEQIDAITNAGYIKVDGSGKLFLSDNGTYQPFPEVKVDVPTKLSQLTNDCGFVNEDSIPKKTSQLENDSDFVKSSQIPTKTSELTNDSDFITSSDVPTKTSELINDSNFATASQIPNKTSQIENDSNFITEHQKLKTINGESISGEGNIEIKSEGQSITIDSELSDVSENPVQNKVVANSISSISNRVASNDSLGMIKSGLVSDDGRLEVPHIHAVRKCKHSNFYSIINKVLTSISGKFNGDQDNYQVINRGSYNLYETGKITYDEVYNALYSNSLKSLCKLFVLINDDSSNSDNLEINTTEIFAVTSLTSSSFYFVINYLEHIPYLNIRPSNCGVVLNLGLSDISFKCYPHFILNRYSNSIPETLSNPDNYVPTVYAVSTALKNKVTVVDGKQLSTNDYTNDDKAKVDAALTEHQSLDNYYTKSEVDGKIASGGTFDATAYYNKEDVDSLLDEKQPKGDYALKSDIPSVITEVTEQTVTEWGFTKNTGTYSKPSDGIPKSDLASSVQISLGKADTALQSESDPTVPSWAKAATKPNYTASEVGALPSTTKIPSKTSDLTNDSGFLTEHQSLSDYYTKSEVDKKISSGGTFDSSMYYNKNEVNTLLINKQDSISDLDSIRTGATRTFKTINGNSIEGEGDIEISSGSNITVDSQLDSLSENPVQNKAIVNRLSEMTVEISNSLTDLIDKKQNILVSGTNIKTVNNKDITGSGNIDIVGIKAANEDFHDSDDVTVYCESDVIRSCGIVNSLNIHTEYDSSLSTDGCEEVFMFKTGDGNLDIQITGSDLYWNNSGGTSPAWANGSVYKVVIRFNKTLQLFLCDVYEYVHE